MGRFFGATAKLECLGAATTLRKLAKQVGVQYSPLPHPLDFDWRFTEGTVDLLWRSARQFCDPDGRIVLLGTPSLVGSSVARSAWLGPISLLERNPITISAAENHIETLRCDVLRDVIPNRKAELVLADPPWYEAEIVGFLWAAAQLCQNGGHVILSAPPVDTRPGIDAERARIDDAAANFGLRRARVYARVLLYSTPFFEANAMSAAGSPVMREWRRGDLVLYSRNNMPVGSRPPAPADECWIEKTLGGTRFRLKQQSAADFASPCLHSVIAGDILPTVSRRDPRRGQADVWTSGNRLFKCFGTAVLAVIIDALNAGGRVIELVASHLGRSLAETEQQAVARAAFQVLDVVKWESVELQRIELGCRMARELGPAIDQSSALRRAG